MFGEAMRMLAADDATETLLLVSKPPAPEVVRQLGEIDLGGKRAVAAFVGWDGGAAPFEIHPTLDAGAFAAAEAAPPGLAELESQLPPRAGDRLLGLFSGGSLAHEAVTILQPALGAIGGNAGDGGAAGHVVYDLGEEEYTQGRPHPMVDLEVRLGMLEAAADDDGIGCVLLDVVIGHGSHPDPAGGLAPALARLAAGRPVIAHVCGTDADPQDAGRQAATCATRARSSRRRARRRRGWPPARSRERGRRREPAHRDADLLGQAARRRGPRARGLRGPRAARASRRAGGARAPRRGAVPADRAAPARRPPRAGRRPFDERIQAMLDAYTDGLRRSWRPARTTSCTPRTACRRTRRSRSATRAWSAA